MGVYLNVADKPKEQWLQENGLEIGVLDAIAHKDFKNVMLIVLVNNIAFSAAAVAYKEDEKTEFLDPSDHRSKRYFLVEKVKMPEAVQKQIDLYQSRR